MSDDSSNGLGVGIALGFTAALALVAVARRLRSGDDESSGDPAEMDTEALLLTIRTRFSELEAHMAELYDRVQPVDMAADPDFGPSYELDEELLEDVMEEVEVDTEVEVDDEFDDLDDEDLGL